MSAPVCPAPRALPPCLFHTIRVVWPPLFPVSTACSQVQAASAPKAAPRLTKFLQKFFQGDSKLLLNLLQQRSIVKGGASQLASDELASDTADRPCHATRAEIRAFWEVCLRVTKGCVRSFLSSNTQEPENLSPCDIRDMIVYTPTSQLGQ